MEFEKDRHWTRNGHNGNIWENKVDWM